MTEMKLKSIYKIYEPIKYAYNTKKEDYIIIEPNAGSVAQYNNAGGNITFEINSVSEWILLSDAYIRCDFEIKHATNDTIPAGNVTLENNFFPSLFSQLTLTAGSNQIENITDPGVYDTMLKTVIYPKDYDDYSGWIPDVGDGNIVETNSAAEALEADSAAQRTVKLVALRNDVHNRTSDTLNTGFIKRKNHYNKTVAPNRYGSFINWKLYPLFGLLEHRKVSIGLAYKLLLVRDNDNAKVLFGDANSNAIISITKLQLHVPILTPSIEVEQKLLTSLNKDIDISFLRRNTVSKITFLANKYTWQITNSSKPARYIFVGFKQGADALTTNNNKFYVKGNAPANSQITRIQVRLNNENYPNQPLTINPNSEDYNEIYRNYKTMCETFGEKPSMELIEFTNNYPIFCFDLSAHKEDLFKTGVQISIYIEKSTAVELTGYCLLLDEAKHTIKIQDKRMVRIE